jgi:kinetochore protein Spc24, fungi type
LRLDTEKFRIAKEAQDAEIEVEKLSKDIASSQRHIEEMENFGDEGGPAGRDARDDEAVLKLKVYRMLGIDVEPDAETGVYSKATVRSRERGDVRVVNVDPKFSRFFYANYFWGAL